MCVGRGRDWSWNGEAGGAGDSRRCGPVMRYWLSPLQSYVPLRYSVHAQVGCAQSVTFRSHAATADRITWSESVVQ